MCEAQLDVRSTGEDVFADTLAELRRTHAGILAILRKASETEAGADAKVLALSGAPAVPSSRRTRRFRGGPVFS